MTPTATSRPTTAGDSGFPFRFTGQKLDPATGLYNYKNRWYDPETGRFLSTDPIGYADGMNIYAYVGGDPVNGRDPSGLAANHLEETDLSQFRDLATNSIGRGFGGGFSNFGGSLHSNAGFANFGGGGGKIGNFAPPSNKPASSGSSSGLGRPANSDLSGKINNQSPAMNLMRFGAWAAQKAMAAGGPKAVDALLSFYNQAIKRGASLLAFGGGVTAIEGVGATGSAGRYVDLTSGQSGSFFSFGFGVGEDVSGGGFGIVWFGDPGSFFGPSLMAEADFGITGGFVLVSGEFSFFGDILSPGPSVYVRGGGIGLNLGRGQGAAASVTCTVRGDDRSC